MARVPFDAHVLFDANLLFDAAFFPVRPVPPAPPPITHTVGIHGLLTPESIITKESIISPREKRMKDLLAREVSWSEHKKRMAEIMALILMDNK